MPDYFVIIHELPVFTRGDLCPAKWQHRTHVATPILIGVI